MRWAQVRDYVYGLRVMLMWSGRAYSTPHAPCVVCNEDVTCSSVFVIMIKLVLIIFIYWYLFSCSFFRINQQIFINIGSMLLRGAILPGTSRRRKAQLAVCQRHSPLAHEPGPDADNAVTKRFRKNYDRYCLLYEPLRSASGSGLSLCFEDKSAIGRGFNKTCACYMYMACIFALSWQPWSLEME